MADTPASPLVALTRAEIAAAEARITAPEIVEMLEMHEHREGIGGAVFDWCDRCGVRWPCEDVRALVTARAFLALVERIERLAEIFEWDARKERETGARISCGPQRVADLLREALLSPPMEPTR